VRLVFLQALNLARNDQIFVAAEVDAMLCGKALCAFADEVNVWTVRKNSSRGANGIANALDAPDSTGAQARAIHDEGIHLHAAFAIEEAAAARVEGLVVFHDDDCFFDGIEG
jgi:hypothetical protein